ncbi:MAG: ATP-dependent DNA helicase PcrA, partial [Candidatus Dadabacteria bacterium]
MQLNPEQRLAVEHTEGPLLILAGAGSGKTRVMVARIARILDDKLARPDEILAVTFTNKAARELIDRCRRSVGSDAQRCWVGTFHGIAARLLRRHADRLGYPPGFSILDPEDQLRVVRGLLKEQGIDPQRVDPAAVLGFIDAAKNEARGPGQCRSDGADPLAEEYAQLYARYQQQLKRSGAMDFGDLILNVLELFRSCPDLLAYYRSRFRYIHVDEYQDTNHAQYLLVAALAANHRNICVVGDDDQSIYTWRGASIRNILEFERDFPGARVVRLERNYRSTRNIIDAAAAVIDHNRERKHKRMWTDAAPGAPVLVYRAADERDEAAYVAERIRELRKSGSVAVFYRTNAQARVIEEALVRAGIGYVVVGAVRFYERKEVKDVLAYLRFVANPDDDVSLSRILNVPPRGIGSATVARLVEWARARGTSMWGAACDAAFRGS